MSKRNGWLRLTSAAVLCLVLAAGRDARAKETGLKIGVVNVNKVFDNYKKKRVLEEDLRMAREQKSRVLREKDKEIKRLTEEIKMLELGSEARKKRESELEKKQVEFRSFTEVTASGLSDRKREITEALYLDIAAVVEEFGRSNGFDLIMKWESVDIKSETLDELLYKINQKTVLFAADTVDITQQVIDRMNEKYAKEIVEK